MTKFQVPKSSICDPLNFERVRDREGTIKEAWRKYASDASRPYSYETFRWLYRQWFSASRFTKELREAEIAGGQIDSGREYIISENFWRSRSSPKAKILALRTGAGVRVRNGSLEITETLPIHLASDGRASVITISGTETRRGHRLASKMTPKTIVLPEHGWYLTAEAVKFCLAHHIALISVAGRSSQGEKGLVSVVAGESQSNAALVRAQVLADPVEIAREVVRAKIETCVAIGTMPFAQAIGYDIALKRAKNVGEILLVEAGAAGVYWGERQCPVRSSSRRWPADWSRFVVRKSWIGEQSPRHADHPVNALLNWSYAVAAGRLATELLARGACLSIGFLHADRFGRYSLAYDALELLRPLIDQKVFAFVSGTVFRMGDFQTTPSGKFRGEVRVSPELLKAFGQATDLPAIEVGKAAEWMVDTILAATALEMSPKKGPSAAWQARL